MVNKRSEVWRHFTQLTKSGIIKGKCAYCGAKINISGQSSHNLIRHLRSQHPSVQIFIHKPNKIGCKTETEQNKIWGFFRRDSGSSVCGICAALYFTATVGDLKRHLDEKHPHIDYDNPLYKRDESNNIDQELDFRSNCDVREDLDEDITSTAQTRNELLIENIVNRIQPSPVAVSTKYTVKRNAISTRNGKLSEGLIRPSKTNSENCQVCKKNEFVLFGRLLSIQMNNFPLDVAINIQLEIQNIIAKKRLEGLEAGKHNIDSQTVQIPNGQFLFRNSNGI